MKNRIEKAIRKVAKWNEEGVAYDKKRDIKVDFQKDIEETVENAIVAKIGNYDSIGEPYPRINGDTEVIINAVTELEVGTMPKTDEKQTIVYVMPKKSIEKNFTYYSHTSLSALLRSSDLPACYKLLKDKILEKMENDGCYIIYFPNIVGLCSDDNGTLNPSKPKFNVLIVCPETSKVTDEYLQSVKDSATTLVEKSFASEIRDIKEGVTNIFEMNMSKNSKMLLQFKYIFDQTMQVIKTINPWFVSFNPYFWKKFKKAKTFINSLWIDLLIDKEDKEFLDAVHRLDFYCENDGDTLYFIKTFVNNKKVNDVNDVDEEDEEDDEDDDDNDIEERADRLMN